MRCSISNIYDATVTLADGFAEAQITVPYQNADRLLNRPIRITMDDGNVFDGIITGINDDGTESGAAVLTATSIVNLAMSLQFYGPSTDYSVGLTTGEAGNSYSGAIFGTPDVVNGTYQATDINYFLKLIINNASEQSRSLWGKRIEYDYTGANSKKLSTGFNWNGDIIQTLFDNMLGTTFDIIVEINGDKITLRNIDKNKPDRTVRQSEIQSQTNGFDLMATSSRVIVESPDVNSQTSGLTALSSANKFYGLPANLDNKFGNNELDLTGGGGTITSEAFIPEKNVYQYVGSGVSGYFKINTDSRYRFSTTLKGEAYSKYGWKRRTAILDEELGRAGNTLDTHLNVTFDRTSEQADIATYYAKVIGDIEYAGSLSLALNKRVRVGDVLRLPDNKRVIVKSIKYGYSEAVKILSYGSIDGNAYQAIKERVRLSEMKWKEEAQKSSPEQQFLYQSNLRDRQQWMTMSRWRSMAGDPFAVEKWTLIQSGAGIKRARKANSTVRHLRDKTTATKRREARNARREQTRKDRMNVDERSAEVLNE